MIFWSWKKDDNFDSLIGNADVCAGAIQWIDVRGNLVSVSSEWTENDRLGQKTRLVEKGEVIGHVDELLFRDPEHFVAGELDKHAANWAEIVKLAPLHWEEVLSWIGNKVSIFPYFRHFKGTFNRKRYDSDQPPHRFFRNNLSCKQFGEFVRRTLLSRLKSGAISLVGKVGQVSPSYIVLLLTVEPTRPRLCHDAGCWRSPARWIE